MAARVLGHPPRATLKRVHLPMLRSSLLTAGLIAFALLCFIEAVYRIVPARAGPDVKTLAKRAERKADPRV